MYTHLRLCGKAPAFTCILCGRQFKHLAGGVDLPSMRQTVSEPRFLEKPRAGGMRQRADIRMPDLRPEVQVQASIAVAYAIRPPR
ncbi:uncharacterized protein LOC144473367 isoform X1 [Augochlora pura]